MVTGTVQRCQRRLRQAGLRPCKLGLVAGEHLHHDLKRMESAYLKRNVRELEITKHISPLQINPGALIALKETGACDFDVPEVLFDLDYPGHYMRRIKMIVTSIAQQASGMFEPNLRDERFLPFEGAGVISTWKLDLPSEFRAFDYDTISDVVLHLRYTARDGGDGLKTPVRKGLTAALNAIERVGAQTGLVRSFSLRQEYPSRVLGVMKLPQRNLRSLRTDFRSCLPAGILR